MADIAPAYSQLEAPERRAEDFQHIPQRPHVHPSSKRVQRTVHDPIAMDSLFPAPRPSQWSSPEAPDFHDVMEKCHAAGPGIRLLALSGFPGCR